MTNRRATVLGAGAWGTTIAVILARAGVRTTLGVRRDSQLALMRQRRENPTYLPGIRLPDELEITDRWTDAVAGADVIVMAIPSSHARAAMSAVASAIRPATTIVSATKGVEPGSLLTMTAMLREIVPAGVRCAALSGPGFAAEVARGKPTALVAAATDEATAATAQELFAGPLLRVYRSPDPIGVELAGTLKNVIAIATGIGDGLDLGSGARAAVITRGLAELMRLGEATGARRETIAGLAGLGDLVLTCTGELSRNRAFGIRLARLTDSRIDLEEREGQPVAEGIANARTAVELARRAGIEMPIVTAVYRVLYEGGSPRAMVEELLNRELKAEF
jgi:glycerol-3-phosphate dehydrogenase (NAD(P)+)